MDNRVHFPYLNALYAVGCASTVAVKGPQHCFTTVTALLCPYYGLSLCFYRHLRQERRACSASTASVAQFCNAIMLTFCLLPLILMPLKRLLPNFVSLTGCFAKLRLYFEVSCATLIYEQHLTSKINHIKPYRFSSLYTKMFLPSTLNALICHNLGTLQLLSASVVIRCQIERYRLMDWSRAIIYPLPPLSYSVRNHNIFC
ncbi:unnamed protein product [Cylicocyclus nassatus]|uniref:Uncharacterized protein n=1 Tax=Cylicocyclus nassatus TaxID=53992 RepID=A0AA36H8V9_CYLNA|nr:unnamed protein product [Cylicocyclus nassatus]